MINRIEQLGQLKTPAQMQLEHAKSVQDSKFGSLLKDELNKDEGVQFSKHAVQRVEQRGIDLTETLLNDINQAVQKAKEKGVKDVVIISQRGAFIVNVPNKTVITTMSEAEMKDNIFTNIDSAMLV